MNNNDSDSKFIGNTKEILTNAGAKALGEILFLENRLQSSRKIVKSLKARADAKRTIIERFADFTTSIAGSFFFLALNTFWFIAWIVINTNQVPSIKAFDPYPFGLLTMVVSLEAIILAILVLISQNRAARVDDIREETDLQVNVIAEQEITKVLTLLVILLKKNGIDVSDDKSLIAMLKPVDTGKLEIALEKEIDK